jgi:hypothetical protein
MPIRNPDLVDTGLADQDPANLGGVTSTGVGAGSTLTTPSPGTNSMAGGFGADSSISGADLGGSLSSITGGSLGGGVGLGTTSGGIGSVATGGGGSPQPGTSGGSAGTPLTNGTAIPPIPVVTTPTTMPAMAPATSTPTVMPAYTPQNESVVDAVNRVTSSGSPLMTRAAGIGAAVANARGLQNSSIAAQSAEKSALDAAVPIASQEAQQAHAENIQAQTGGQQAALQDSQNANQTGIANLQSDTSRTIATQQLSAASQTAFAQALLAASSSYDSNVSAIMANPDLKADARQSALNAAAAQRNSDFTMIQRVYGVSLSGSGGGSGTGSNAGTGAFLNWTATGNVNGAA